MNEEERDDISGGEESIISDVPASKEQDSAEIEVETSDIIDDGGGQAAEDTGAENVVVADSIEAAAVDSEEFATSGETVELEEAEEPTTADETVVREPADSPEEADETVKMESSDSPKDFEDSVRGIMGSPKPPSSDSEGGSTSASSSSDKASTIKEQVLSHTKIVIAAVVAVVAVIVIFLAWPCDHEWAEATCTEPATCTKCGKTEGEALGHDYAEATCTKPETCTRCGDTQGSALGHEWSEATCTEPEICERCGVTQGEALGHEVAEWTVTREATCSEEGEQEGVCTVCGETVTESIDKTAHTEGEWVTTKEPTVTEDGERSLTCSVCGEVIKTEAITLSQIEKALLSLGTFDEVTVTGSGDDVVDIPCAGMPCIIEISHSGSHNFAVWSVDSSGDNVDLLVNEIGSYSGTVTTYTDYDDAAMLAITAGGSWSVTFKPMSAMEEATNGSSFTGDNVVLINADELTKVSFTHSGSSNFAVWGIGMTDVDLLVNEIGSYDGTVIWSQPQSFLIVNADGTWTVSW